jgi:Holliday junction resolvase RusA-like endonuclease
MMPSHEIILRMTVPGEPVPKGRPRFGKGRTFTPVKTRQAEAAVKWAAVVARLKGSGHGKPTADPIALTCRFYRANGRTADLDNLVKLVTDALNGIVWKDDRQVVQLHASRFDRQERPRTEIEIYRVLTLSLGRSKV